MSKAPVCLIQPVIDKTQPPSVFLPSIPQATDLASAIAAINAIAQVLRQLGFQGPFSSFGGPRGAAGKTGKTGKQGQAPKGGRFQEIQVDRVTKQVTVASKQDPDTTITFKQIDGLTFKDSKTGELWSWHR